MKKLRISAARLPAMKPAAGSLSILLAVLLAGACAAAAQQTAPQPRPTGPAQGQTIDLRGALERARANSQQLQSAKLATQLAREDSLQARVGLLPTLGFGNQMIYTQGNGTPSGVFVANDGVHVYNSQASVHQDVLSIARVLEYRRTVMSQAISEAKAEVLARGLAATVVQDYYAFVLARRRANNALQSQQEAQRLVEISEKLEKGGEAAHSDVVKAQILLVQRRRDLQESQLGIEKARISLAVLLFPDLRLDYDVADDLKAPEPLAPFDEFSARAAERSPDLRAAQMTLKQEALGIRAARSAYLPSLSFDYWFGIDANQFATYSGDIKNLGSSAQATLSFPLWNWGATRSKVRQAEIRRSQAQLDLTLTQKQLLSELRTLYAEARSTLDQSDSLRSSVDLSAESLRLTLLRYEAGEISMLEVVDAQSTLTQARSAYDDGLSRYRIAVANLETLTGTL